MTDFDQNKFEKATNHKKTTVKKSIDLSFKDMALIQQGLMALQYQFYYLNDSGIKKEIVELKNRLTDEFYNRE